MFHTYIYMYIQICVFMYVYIEPPLTIDTLAPCGPETEGAHLAPPGTTHLSVCEAGGYGEKLSLREDGGAWRSQICSCISFSCCSIPAITCSQVRGLCDRD